MDKRNINIADSIATLIIILYLLAMLYIVYIKAQLLFTK